VKNFAKFYSTNFLRISTESYRKTSNTSHRLLLEQMAQTLACIGDLALIRDPASIKTLPTCHIKLFSFTYR